MKPYTRELITDRRQPSLRWSAIFAGATVGVALWAMLQILGLGVGLVALDLDTAGSLRSVGIGTTIWSMLAPMLALFVGGWVAGRLAITYDQRSGAMHGFVTWAVMSVIGVIATISIVGMIARVAASSPAQTASDVELEPTYRQAQLEAMSDDAGKALLGVGISILLGMGTAIAGGGLAARKLARPRVNTSEVPVVPPPNPPPPDAPHVE